MLNSKFYRQCYLQTGWIPMQPLSRPIKLGDVCQVHHNCFQPLMNIDQISLIEDILISAPIKLNPIDWRINEGVQQTFCSTERVIGETADVNTVCNDVATEPDDSDNYIHWTKQVLSFSDKGSFLFHGDRPKCQLILNWHKIKKDAILKLTQTHYTFRDIYVVTGVASVDDWGLAISGEPQAQLEMSAETQTTDLFNLISHKTAQTDQCKNIATYEKSHNKTAHFFKAKKLVISDEMHDHYLIRLLENNRDLNERAIANWFNNSLLNLTKANELNLATTMNFFDWIDASLDDIARLLGQP